MVPQPVKVRGRSIDRDENGLLNLSDIWSASGRTVNQKPHDWLRLGSTLRLVESVFEAITGKSRNWSKQEMKSALYTKRGKGGGSYADVRLALAYAEYLDPKLALEVREIFLRYKAADPTLADDILDRASPEANEWVATRALGRVTRNDYTDTLRDHGVTGGGYGLCTNETYLGLYGKPAATIRRERGLPAKANVRESMTKVELASVMLAEALSTERIRDEDSAGTEECRRATRRSATSIKNAIENDRQSRNRRMIG
ncbi:KilA-N domain-containing protein [Mesorhizobium sp. BR1-1-16]|uniref:KilA-N domain-containing protein n=1 Tax=Mesorhizobium sp. BR1-1-16 TaxID=2876653 RepID=UPI001CC965B5|nr:KilA-N domain-containing protein [Mesorhizobium sp. BR1-1-16]MBZ9936612.1 KilA-N domain-containing protein [Mesorhizobium sp. BR1-1-16]